MTHRPQLDPNLILPIGTRVVILAEMLAPGGGTFKGSMGRIVQSPADARHSYRVGFVSGIEASFTRNQFALLTEYQEGSAIDHPLEQYNLTQQVIFKSLVGSRAYGLETEASDWDWRGIYLPPATMHWSLFGVPEQLENDATQEVYWEAAKFLTLVLKANPGVLECLYSPQVKFVSPVAQDLLSIRDRLLSKLVYQTYGGYIMSQFAKIQADLRNHHGPKWKHVMHLLRLLQSGIRLLREGTLVLEVLPDDRQKLVEIRDGLWSFEACETWRHELQAKFDDAFTKTNLPDRPDYTLANDWLISARRSMVGQ